MEKQTTAPDVLSLRSKPGNQSGMPTADRYQKIDNYRQGKQPLLDPVHRVTQLYQKKRRHRRQSKLQSTGYGPGPSLYFLRSLGDAGIHGSGQ